MKFPAEMDKLQEQASVGEAQQAIRAVHGRAASRWVAAEEGVSRRTAQRWLSADPPASRGETIRDLAVRSRAGVLAATRIKNSTRIFVGKMVLLYDGDRDGGPRGPRSDLAIDDLGLESRGFFDALAAGDFDVAEGLFGEAVLEAYGPGMSEKFTVGDFVDGIEIW